MSFVYLKNENTPVGEHFTPGMPNSILSHEFFYRKSVTKLVTVFFKPSLNSDGLKTVTNLVTLFQTVVTVFKTVTKIGTLSLAQINPAFVVIEEDLSS